MQRQWGKVVVLWGRARLLGHIHAAKEIGGTWCWLDGVAQRAPSGVVMEVGRVEGGMVASYDHGSGRSGGLG